MNRILMAAALVIAGGLQAQDLDGDCSRAKFNYNGQEAHVARQVIEAGNLRALKVTTANAPMSITGGNASGYTITICKAAASLADLDAIRVSFDGGELKATGPRGGQWSVAYKVYAPHNGDIQLDSSNGPVSVRDYDGSFVARSTNGPISLNNVSGNIEVTSSNGPVRVSGAAGSVKLRASNGPVSVQLTGTHWKGSGLEAQSDNGPLSLKFPASYASGITAEAEGGAPISCKAPGCERFADAIRLTRTSSDGQPRRIELGSGAAAVRLKTNNGPLTIRQE